MKIIIAVTSLLLITGSQAILNAKYKGCFSDEKRIVNTTTLHKHANSTLTSLKCTVFCFSNGYKYAATRNGTECHCGDLPERADESLNLMQDDESLCNVPCVGDMSIMCGGQTAVTLFSTGIIEGELRVSDTRRWQFGCFEDSGPQRFLWHHKVDFIRANSPVRCIAYCKALGYPFAGVEYKVECHCGIAKLNLPIAEGCDKPCAADPQINCGGNWRIMVYSTQTFGLSADVEEGGCCQYNEEIGITSTNIPQMTPNRCVAFCVNQGLPFAYIHKTECLCSKAAPHMKTRTSKDKCNEPCAGQLNMTCGGDNHMIFYRTGTRGDASLGKLLSCFKDEDNDILSGAELSLGNENSVSFCISRCLQAGYAFAGIRNRAECKCSHTFPSSLRRSRPDSSCSLPCYKNELQNCGGDKYTSVYRTGLPPNNVNLTGGLGVSDGSDSFSYQNENFNETNSAENFVNSTKEEEGELYNHSFNNYDDVVFSDVRDNKTDPADNIESSSKGFFGYLGCYLDNRLDVQLTAERRSSESSMSIQQCSIFCFLKAYKFSATRRGSECFCGDLSEDSIIVPDSDELCDRPCRSDPKVNCGGQSAFTVYSTGIQERGIDANKLRIGCLIDRGDSRLIREHKAELRNTNTPTRCIAYCKALGYPNAGVQFGLECFCGMTERKSPDIDGCNTPCSGDPNQDCGGNWRLHLYSTGAPKRSRGRPFPGYIGCFSEGRSDVIMSDYNSTGRWMSIQQCNLFCFHQAFKYSALKNGNECTCIDLSEDTLAPDSDQLCNSPCLSDKLTNCGGVNALSIHSTGIHENEIGDIDELRIGCLEDSINQRLIKEHKAELTITNTPQRCIAYCTAQGYANAGVQYGFECFCGMVSRTSPTVDGCDMPCAGNDRQKCGGQWRLDVFTTRISESVTDFTEVRGPNDQDNLVTPTRKFAGYVGCFRDDRGDVKISAELRMTERTLTIQQCSNYCFQKGYKFTATRNGTQCSCGDLSEENLPKPDEDRLCDKPCLTDETTMCGGAKAYTIYSTGIRESDVGDLDKLRVGCLSDTDETRLIEEHKADLTKTNTPRRCVAYCKALGYPHAGLQYGIECFCGLSQRSRPLVDGCDVPCAGNANINCGGHWRLEVYATGTNNGTTDITLDGCYVYNEDAAITRKVIDKMTPNKCVANCYQQGLPYAHLYNGVECLCGKLGPQLKLRVTVAKCNMTCQGDENSICGGVTHMLSYTTGINGNPILGREESCYRDDNNDILNGTKYDLGMENSIEFCISRCIEEGYAFAGLRNTKECQCSHKTPSRSLRQMVSNVYCDAPCPRIELQNCGGAVYLALYRTGIVPNHVDTSLAEVTPGYIGCFKDSRAEVRLSGDQATVRSLTAAACNTRCFKQGFKHAATRNGKECYCGDIEGEIPQPDDEKLCNVQCSSDITARCGGRDAYSIYSTGINEDDLENLEDYEIGCLLDNEDIRLIPEHKVDLTINNSPKRCIAYCRALGYIHAGVQYSIECYCGMARKTYPLDAGCDKACSGDSDYVCGGDWKANVYTTGFTKAAQRIALRGCFNYTKELISTRKTIAKMDHNRCVAHCFTQGLAFAFIHNGFECLCGTKMPATKLNANIRQCDVPCPNDANLMCGGAGYMTALSTGVVGNPSLGKLVGCYKDEKNDLMTGRKMNLGQLNTIVLCISRCIEEGFAYAGLRNTNECQCSQTIPKREPVLIVPDYECSSPCPMNNLETCGAPLFTAVHRTGLIPSTQGKSCPSSLSRVNNKVVCGGETLFIDEFKTLDTERWKHNVRISGEDGEFVIYTKKKKNVYIQDDKLVIQPTIISQDNFIKHGRLDLKGCTGVEEECVLEANSYQILPPVESGQICTTNTFNFRYGIITVRAKFPKGDWVEPQIWLKPVKEVYGKGYISGKILLVSSRGNADLVGPEGNDIGAKIVESGFQVSTEPYWNILQRTETLTGSEPWYNAFHDYTFTWTPDTLLFYVDGNVLSGLKTLYRISDRTLLDEVGLKKEPHWRNGSIVAPFDADFYLCVGVSVGGMRNFPDGSTSNGVPKPWENKDIKNRLKFYLNKQQWASTWSEDTKLEVDSIKITAY